jgi:urease subunit alpha
MAHKISREEYASMFSPTKGDRLHLGDTDLIIEIEHDFIADHYGDEAISGGGKAVRDGMGITPGITSEDGALDVVITDIIIMDPILGIVKGDIGIKNGIIVGIGKAGNPDVMDITPGLIIGGSTEIITGKNGMIATAGGIDGHIHHLSPHQAWEALSNGITTMIGGGNGCKTLSIEAPGPFNLHRMIEAFEDIPVNLGVLGRGTSCRCESIREQALNGAIGMKIHEDWGATRMAIDTCLAVADEYDFQVQIHTDTLNEGGYVEDTIKTFNGRTIHCYHVEGAGGGHAPDVLKVCGELNVLPSSTNPTNPYTINTVEEHKDMIITVHHLNPRLPEDISFANSRVRSQSIAAEDVLHDMGAISMMSSDSQGMGRVGETVLRTWQLASKMKKQRGPLEGESGRNDNERVLRYLSKYTVNPAITFGIDHCVGSIAPGKYADIVIWDPKFFGTKPDWVLKGGFLVWSPIGDANASIGIGEPVSYKTQYGARGNNCNRLCKVFVTKAAIENGLGDKVPNSAMKLTPVKNTRNLTKLDMIRNTYCPQITIDPVTFQVFADGVYLTCDPADTLPLCQKYYFR